MGRLPPTRLDELAEHAIAWAEGQLGSPRYTGRCLAFVEDAYERPNGIEVFGGSSASESAALYGVKPLGTDPPPRGALVFFACGGPIGGVIRDWGHVGLSLGDGRVVHAWNVVRIDSVDEVTQLPPPSGWSAPRTIGWTPSARLLADHRRRRWSDE